MLRRWARISCFLLIGIVACGCEKAPTPKSPVPAASGYPAHWWAAVSKEGAPEWEIMPQEAKRGEVILSKRNELGLLSNFAATPFEYRGKRYASLEGFWQMMKYPEGRSTGQVSTHRMEVYTRRRRRNDGVRRQAGRRHR
jgi:hypothetical protein